MRFTREEIDVYLSEVFQAVDSGRYQISYREKNQDIYIDYIFTEEDAKNVILSLEADDFSKAVPNEHPKFADEILYIFGKEISLLPRYRSSVENVSLYIKFNKLKNQYLIVVSFHKQEYPLSYMFK